MREQDIRCNNYLFVARCIVQKADLPRLLLQARERGKNHLIWNGLGFDELDFQGEMHIVT